MQRHDWLWLAFRGTGLFFVAKSILLVPLLINAMRMRDLVFGGTELDVPLLYGAGGIATCLGVYALAAVVMFLVPVGSRAAPGDRCPA